MNMENEGMNNPDLIDFSPATPVYDGSQESIEEALISGMARLVENRGFATGVPGAFTYDGQQAPSSYGPTEPLPVYVGPKAFVALFKSLGTRHVRGPSMSIRLSTPAGEIHVMADYTGVVPSHLAYVPAYRASFRLGV
jgi:hypothetical protein